MDLSPGVVYRDNSPFDEIARRSSGDRLFTRSATAGG
jgi:hypothetical protein